VAFLIELTGTEFKNDNDYEEIGKKGKENPVITANVYSRWSFGWMTPLMKVRGILYIS